MRLRKMSTEQDRLQREIGDVARQLKRTEAVIMMMALFIFVSLPQTQDMDDVKNQLQKAKQDNHELESELRSTAT